MLITSGLFEDIIGYTARRKMLSVNKLIIRDVGRIAALDLIFESGVNLICGPNGIGKTTILECVGNAFSRIYETVVRKRAGSDSGSYSVIAKAGDDTFVLESKVAHFDPTRFDWTTGAGEWERWVITLKNNRTFTYLKLDSLAKDPSDINRHRELAGRGIEFQDIKNWFVNRYMFAAHAGLLSQAQIANLDLAKRAFSELDPSVSFSKVNPSTFDIMVATPDGEIYFEYLSSGFKSCLCLVIGLIKEIEYRFTDPFVSAVEFAGVVVIDELDLHLHPEWQPKLTQLIKRVFPKAQFIAATHSPHMIQAAAPQEIIALEEDNDRRVRRRQLPSNEYGFQGWTIEEILTDVMGMTDTRSREYRRLYEEFDTALLSDDAEKAERISGMLDRFLHPNSAERKLFKLQLGRLGEAAR